MDYLKSFPALESLVHLADRDEIDINPILLRVLTDLYVAKPTHTADEERQYAELALRLFEKVGVAVRHTVATKLAEHASAPLTVVRRLARDVFAVAEPILRFSQRLDSTELAAIARELGGGHAALIAEREGRAQQVRRDQSPKSAGPFASSEAVKSELNDMFFAANAAERRMILLNLHYAPKQPIATPPSFVAGDVIRRLELAALGQNVLGFARELARVFALPQEQARRISQDPSGEPIVVVAKALAMPGDVLQRILLCLNPAIGQSVQRVYDLLDLYAEIRHEACLQMLAIWQSHKQTAAHQPYQHDDEIRRRPEGIRSQPQPLPAPQRNIQDRRFANGPFREAPAKSNRKW
jgi:hypothetical protein